jgi:hypothetical protein
MQISLSKLYAAIAILVGLGLTSYSGYFLYVVFFDGPQPSVAPSLNTLNLGILDPKVQQAVSAIVDPVQKIALNKNKDISFVDSPLYKSFTVKPGDIPLSASRGRPNPFVPYVAP